MPTWADGTASLRVQFSVAGVAELSDIFSLPAGAARMRWPGPGPAPTPGLLARVELELRSRGETLVFRGIVEGPGEGDPPGAWLYLPEAAAVLQRYEQGRGRQHRRLDAEHLALVSSPAAGQVLCRLRDLCEGGARVLLAAEDAAPVGEPTSLTLLDAADGRDLTLAARVAWIGRYQVGLRFAGGHLRARRALRNLLLARH
jgi:hypothetical protein